ncbi:hypothetical protein LguiB_019318 [Lonicera macranthoides]
MGLDNLCNTGLVLGLGNNYSSENNPVKSDDQKSKPSVSLNLDHLSKPAVGFEPSLTLGLSGESYDHVPAKTVDGSNNNNNNKVCSKQSMGGNLYRQDSGDGSSYSNVSVKRERDINEEGETERVVCSRVSDEEDEGVINGRKKLRLTKAQSALLEESFKQHSTLNPKQKQELARELKLRPRQVEVWFQNRRARTKLKQTEVDCEYLKKCCETLTDENRRLQKEVQELKALKLAQPLYMQLPAATLTMCPSCERIGDKNSSKTTTPFTTMAPSKPLFYNPFSNSSAAC